MFGIGMSEMLVIVGVALLVFGPTELPQIAKKIARGVRDVRRMSDDLRRSIDIDEDDEHVRKPRGPLGAPPSITGSALNDEPHDDVVHAAADDTGAPSIVPVAAVAVGSAVDDESTIDHPDSTGHNEPSGKGNSSAPADERVDSSPRLAEPVSENSTDRADAPDAPDASGVRPGG